MVRKSSHAIAAKGERIYSRKYARSYEREHFGKFVAVDVDSERAYIGDSPEEALKHAQEKNPKKALSI